MSIKTALIITGANGAVPQTLLGMSHLVKDRVTIFSGEKPGLAEQIRKRPNIILIDGELGNSEVHKFFTNMKNMVEFLNISTEIYCFKEDLKIPDMYFTNTPLKDFLEGKLT